MTPYSQAQSFFNSLLNPLLSDSTVTMTIQPQRKSLRGWIRIIAFVGCFMLACPAVQARSAESFAPGSMEWSFSVGFGQNFHTPGNVPADVNYVPLLVSWAKTFHQFTSGSDTAFALEGFLSYVRQENEDRYLIGLTPLLIYNFKPCGKWIPYAEAGVGIAATNLDPEGFGGDFGFTPQAGIGIRYALSNRQFIRIAYRYHHISNANLKENNRSIDTNLLFIGCSFTY